MMDKALYRIDPLTGCFNLLGYLEWLSDETRRGPCSLLSLDVNAFGQYNSALGRTAGDDVLRWVVLVVEDENPAPVYRIDGDEFVVVLEGETLPAQRVLVQRLYDRMNQEAGRVGLVAPAVTVTLVHYPAQVRCTPAEVLGLQLTALRQAKALPGRPPQYFLAGELQVEPDIARRLLDGIIQRMVGLGGALDEMQALAYSDPLTGLPNVRAATVRLQAAGSAALAVLMIDGDNLRLYNDMGGYAAGDRMIQALSGVLRGQLRPDDFLARWRMGDEFLALLPGVDVEGAVAVGRRLCAAVRQASTEWLRPVTISVGAAARPEHGTGIDELVAEAERAKELAKAQGKDRVVEITGQG
jgi:diguanylate cyclase (GGDEF)-like protein